MCGFCVLFTREKAKSKEREEAWIKIENLAKSNPQVSCVCVCVCSVDQFWCWIVASSYPFLFFQTF